MIRDMVAQGELPTGKHALGTIHKRHRQFRRNLNKHQASMRARQVNATLKAKPARQPETKAPLFTRVKNAFARMLRR